MKIAIISAGGYFKYEDYTHRTLQGTEGQIWVLAKEFANKGHEVYIIRRWYNSQIEKSEMIGIISVKSLNITKPGFKLALSKLSFSKKAAKIVENLKIEILLIIDPFTSFFLLNRGIPKILLTHTMIPLKLINNQKRSLWELIFFRLKVCFQNYFYNKSDLIISLNQDINDYLVNNGFKSIVIPNAIDIDKYTPTNLDEKYVLFGGRLVKEKGIDILIKAYSLLSKNLQKEYNLIIVGSGPEKEYLKTLVSELDLFNYVKFLEWLPIDDFINLVSRCSIFVLPSEYETFGVVIIEAMALEKPVIASATFGPRDIISHNYNGYLFAKRNIEELKYYLELLLNDENLRNKMGINGRKTVEKKYCFDTISEYYVNLFNEFVGDSK